MSIVTLLPPTGRTLVWNGEPSENSARSIVPAPMSATATPSSFSGLGQDGLGRGERARHELVDLHAGGDDALRQVLDRRRRGGDDVGLDLEPDARSSRAGP